MSVTSVDKDIESLSLKLIADFTAPAERVWQLWADPRQLEHWWGPPTYPATVTQHDLTIGGSVNYLMTGPDGEKFPGWWHVTDVNAPTSLEFTDGFAEQDGTPNADMPTVTTRVELTEHEGGTRMHLLSLFNSKEDMDQLMEMGMEDGLTEAVGQMDDLLTR